VSIEKQLAEDHVLCRSKILKGSIVQKKNLVNTDNICLFRGEENSFSDGTPARKQYQNRYQ
jgi:hypothetical protein